MAVLKRLAPDGRVIDLYPLDKPRVVLGREHDVDIALPDPSVSRHHAMLVESPRGWLAIAMESTNGLKVGGVRVQQANLVEGSILELGQTVLQFSLGDSRQASTIALAAAPPAVQAHYPPQAQYPQAPHPYGPAPGAPAPAARGGSGWLIAMIGGAGLLGAGLLVAGGLYYFSDDLDLGSIVAPSGTSGTPVAPSAVQPITSGPGPGDGVGVSGPLFEVDTTQAVFPLDVNGGSGAELSGKLADKAGRRTIVFRAPGGAEEVVFAAAWNLPAVAAVASDGSVLVCGNALTGAASSLTRGGLPDPRSGVTLGCRQRKDGAWGAVLTPASGSAAHWLVDVKPAAEGFEVTYSLDQSRFLLGQPSAGDGVYRASFSRGAFAAPQLVERLDEPFRRVPTR